MARCAARCHIAQVLLPGAAVNSADDWPERFSALTPD